MPSATIDLPSDAPSKTIARSDRGFAASRAAARWTKRAIDLQAVDRQADRWRKRRVAGAEVVDRSGRRRGRAARSSVGSAASRRSHQDVLGQLERQLARLQLRPPRSRALTRPSRPGWRDVVARDVDVHRSARRARRRAAAIRAAGGRRFAARSRSAAMISPASSAIGDEERRADHAELGMVPARQRLEARRRGAMPRSNSGWYATRQLARRQRAAQVALESHAMRHFGLQQRRRTARTAPCRRPWPCTSRCRRRAASRRRAVAEAAEGDADAGAGRDVVAGDPERRRSTSSRRSASVTA